MAHGRVKWFNDARGFGVIERPESAGIKEIFVHYTAISGEGHKTLSQGQEVEFDLYESPKGLVAKNVQRAN